MAFIDIVTLLRRIANGIPIGQVDAFAGSTAPDDWLFCDGRAVSRTTYSKLYSVIGTTWGSGDGSTTFNLPDLRGRALIGVNSTALPNGQNASLTARTVGTQNIGTENAVVVSHTHTMAHTHGMAHTHSHSHVASGYISSNAPSGSSKATPCGRTNENRSGVYTTDTDATASSKSTTDGSSATNTGPASGAVAGTGRNMQPSAVVNYIIYAGV